MQIPFDLAIPFSKVYPKKIIVGFSHDFGLKALNAIIFIIVKNVKNLNVGMV